MRGQANHSYNNSICDLMFYFYITLLYLNNIYFLLQNSKNITQWNILIYILNMICELRWKILILKKHTQDGCSLPRKTLFRPDVYSHLSKLFR